MYWLILVNIDIVRQKQDLRSLHTESEMFTYVLLFFSYSSSFLIKMNATDAKPQKIEPDSNFFLTDESFGGSVQTWLTEREVVFIFERAMTFRIQICQWLVHTCLNDSKASETSQFSCCHTTNNKLIRPKLIGAICYCLANLCALQVRLSTQTGSLVLIQKMSDVNQNLLACECDLVLVNSMAVLIGKSFPKLEGLLFFSCCRCCCWIHWRI